MKWIYVEPCLHEELKVGDLVVHPKNGDIVGKFDKAPIGDIHRISEIKPGPFGPYIYALSFSNSQSIYVSARRYTYRVSGVLVYLYKALNLLRKPFNSLHNALVETINAKVYDDKVKDIADYCKDKSGVITTALDKYEEQLEEELDPDRLSLTETDNVTKN
jgi:hypothetical protein